VDKEAQLRVNPEQVPAFWPEGRGVDKLAHHYYLNQEKKGSRFRGF
jgi:hypothetical protein